MNVLIDADVCIITDAVSNLTFVFPHCSFMISIQKRLKISDNKLNVLFLYTVVYLLYMFNKASVPCWD